MNKPSSLPQTLAQPYPVLFVLIGWTHGYDGTEHVRGRHAFLRENPRDNSEACAFLPGRDGTATAGVGRGKVDAPLVHVVFVARDWEAPGRPRKLVGVYAGARIELDGDWARASTRNFYLLPVDERPVLPNAAWWGDTGMRRWARTAARKEPKLLSQFEWNRKRAAAGAGGARTRNTQVDDQGYWDSAGREGALRLQFVKHRRREARLRDRKIQKVLEDEGTLRCQVPGCGFSFAERYGELGVGYAQVHHLNPLASAPRRGHSTTLSDLAVVCANCHAMIHRFGMSRDLASVLPRRKLGKR